MRVWFYLRIGILCLAWIFIAYVDVYSIILFVQRLSYPYALEWQENYNVAMILGDWRAWYKVPVDVHSGMTIYPPVYFLLAKIWVFLFPKNFISLRIFSALIPFLLSVLLAHQIGQCLKHKYIGFYFCVFFFAYLYYIPWIDLVRMEMWLLCLSMWFVYAFMQGQIKTLALVLSLAVYTKQSCIMLFFPIVWAAVFENSKYWTSFIYGIIGVFLFYFCFSYLWGPGFAFNFFEVLEHRILLLQQLWILRQIKKTSKLFFWMFIALLYMGFYLASVRSFVSNWLSSHAQAIMRSIKLFLVSLTLFLISTSSFFKEGGGLFNFCLWGLFSSVILALLVSDSNSKKYAWVAWFGIFVPSPYLQVNDYYKLHQIVKIKHPIYHHLLEDISRQLKNRVYVVFNPFVTASHESHILLVSPRFSHALTQMRGLENVVHPLDFMKITQFDYVIADAYCYEKANIKNDEFSVSQFLLKEGYHLAAEINPMLISTVGMGCTFFSHHIYIKDLALKPELENLIASYPNEVSLF